MGQSGRREHQAPVQYDHTGEPVGYDLAGDYEQPPLAPYRTTAVVPVPPRSLPRGPAIAGLVLGILGMLTSFFGFLGFPLQVTGIVFSGIALSNSRKGIGGGRGMAIAGLTLSIASLVFGLLVTLFLFVAIATNTHG